MLLISLKGFITVIDLIMSGIAIFSLMVEYLISMFVVVLDIYSLTNFKIWIVYLVVFVYHGPVLVQNLDCLSLVVFVYHGPVLVTSFVLIRCPYEGTLPC